MQLSTAITLFGYGTSEGAIKGWDTRGRGRVVRGTPQEFADAVRNTQDAKVNDDGSLQLHVARYQKPEQAGAKSVRTGVFFLPEPKSSQQRYYTTGRQGYGGHERVEGIRTYKNPIIAKGASGGNVPKIAYDAIKGKGAYDAMRNDVLNKTGMTIWNKPSDDSRSQMIAAVLQKYGGDPTLANDIVRYSKQGNELPYAIQEHIVAHAARDAGHDAIIGYNKIKGQHRLSEVFDLGMRNYPTVSGFK